MSRILILCVLLLLTMRSASAAAAGTAGSATWEAAMTATLGLVEAGKFDELIDQRLSPAFIAKLKTQHGEESWRSTIRTRLERLAYYFRRIEDADKRTVSDKDGRVMVRGEYGCFAEFDKVEGVYLLGGFGQEVTSM